MGKIVAICHWENPFYRCFLDLSLHPEYYLVTIYISTFKLVLAYTGRPNKNNWSLNVRHVLKLITASQLFSTMIVYIPNNTRGEFHCLSGSGSLNPRVVIYTIK